MSQASEILHTARNADGAMKRAEAARPLVVDQDWDHEATIYEFDDKSVLVVSGPQCNSYDSREAAEKALAD